MNDWIIALLTSIFLVFFLGLLYILLDVVLMYNKKWKAIDVEIILIVIVIVMTIFVHKLI